MADSEEVEFKRITRTFFEKEWKENFDIFYQVSVDGEKKFVKFTDVFNALTSRRSYGEVRTPIQALTLMKRKIGDQFDPQLLATFIQYAGR